MAATHRTLADLTGKVYGRWTVVRFSHRTAKSGAYYLCRCECGTEKTVRGGSLAAKVGPSTSCGCYAKEASSRSHTKHGRYRTRTYNSWMSMIQRCENPNHDGYKHYGGRGISICKKWRESFEAFFADMGESPTNRHSIDRIDSDGDYTPSNCRWATAREQNGNRRTAIQITHDGRTMCVAAWAREAGMRSNCLRRRLANGWGIKEAIDTPSKKAPKQ